MYFYAIGQPGEGNTVPFFIDPTFSDLAKKYDAAVGQILISWAVQRGTAVIPKSEKVERMQQMLSVRFVLSFIISFVAA